MGLIPSAVGLHGVKRGQHPARNTSARTGQRGQLEPEHRQQHLPAALASPTAFGRHVQAARAGWIETTAKLCSQQLRVTLHLGHVPTAGCSWLTADPQMVLCDGVTAGKEIYPWLISGNTRAQNLGIPASRTRAAF